MLSTAVHFERYPPDSLMKNSPLALIILFAAAPLFAQSPALEFGETFWSYWGDGKAELSGYDLEFPRYGEIRNGTAVLIFVTEPFTVEPRVKADGPNAETGTLFQVMKLNLVRDFPTGIYDYNTMTSTFVGLEPFAGLPAGAPAKVTFSSQEWCGQVWEQAIFHRDRIDLVSHSYFGAEADRSFSIARTAELWTEDQLFHWARGFALPASSDGPVKLPMIPSLLQTRLSHEPVETREVVLRRDLRAESVEVPAGVFETSVQQAVVSGGPTWTFWVESAPPHRIVKWETDDGESGVLRGSARLPYWKMNGSAYRDALKEIGL